MNSTAERAAVAAGARQSKSFRWNAIRRIIRERPVGTQEELARLLAQAGCEVTQATLSRDLAQLGAVRVPRPSGMAYELSSSGAVPGDELLELGAMVLSVAHNGNLVVMQTQPGAASAVARGIDLARLPELLGTVAGDDTIFVAPAQKSSAQKLAKRLRTLFGKGE